MSFAIEVCGLAFTYAGADTPVLRDLSWQVPTGAFALLVGGTGSGKSTLLSLLKPQVAPAGARSGTVRVLGRPLAELGERESAGKIGYVFQSPDNQICCESVWHEMAFGLENLGTPQDEMRRLVAETSYFLGMEDWFRHETDSLSGGRKQLLALASTLVMQPRILLLDEPTAQLDPIAERNFLHALFRVNHELGITVVVATHRPRPMVDYATCAFRLEDGALRRLDDLGSLRVREAIAVPGAPAGAGWAPRETAHASKVDEFAKNCKTNPPLSHGCGLPGAPNTHESRGGGAIGSPDDPRPGVQQGVKKTFFGKFIQKEKLDRPARPAVTLQGAWFRYERDADWVLRNLDLSVASGGIHALVGGNGCGKSTLLSIIAGTSRLQRGRVACATDARALLPQDPRALFVCDTVDDELMEWSSAGGYGLPAAHAMLERLRLTAAHSLSPYDLSGGQQQLLALGKLLLTRPRLLLLDEPTKGLDLPCRRVVAALLQGLRDDGATVVMATHDLDFAQQVADDVSMMFDGEIACTQACEEFFRGNVYYRP